MDVAEDNKAFETGVLEKASGPSSELSSEVGINASGHKQELERNFSLLSICGVAITTGVSWTSVGGSVVNISIAGKWDHDLTLIRLLLSTMAVHRESSSNCMYETLTSKRPRLTRS